MKEEKIYREQAALKYIRITIEEFKEKEFA